VLAATVFCLRPTSIRVTESVKWTTCPTTPKAESCLEGTNSVAFHSTGSGFGGDPESWGGENFPGAGIFGLPGKGTFRCDGYYVSRQHGRILYERHRVNLPLKDQAAGFAVVGNAIKVATSLHPGLHGLLGQAAGVKLGQPNKCIFAGLPTAPETVRTLWPGKSRTAASLAGASTTVTSAGKLSRSLPVPPDFGLGDNVKLELTINWASTIVVRSALKK
jgi:hypothetical protein